MLIVVIVIDDDEAEGAKPPAIIMNIWVLRCRVERVEREHAAERQGVREERRWRQRVGLGCRCCGLVAERILRHSVA